MPATLTAAFIPNSLRPGLAVVSVVGLPAIFGGSVVIGSATALPVHAADITLAYQTRFEDVTKWTWTRDANGNTLQLSFDLPAFDASFNGRNIWCAIFRSTDPYGAAEAAALVYGPILQSVLP